MEYLLPCRLSTEVSENVFSIVRCGCGDAHPTPCQAKSELKTLCLSEALDPPKGSSYASAGGWSAVTLLDLPPKSSRCQALIPHGECNDDAWEPPTVDLFTLEDYGVYHMAGWSLGKVAII
jgi:hypothetical protein